MNYTISTGAQDEFAAPGGTSDGVFGHHSTAVQGGALVAAEAYRLALENEYPAAVKDGYDATCRASDHAAQLGANLGKLILMGDCAVRAMASVVSLMSRDFASPHISLEALICPGLVTYGFIVNAKRSENCSGQTERRKAQDHGKTILQ